MATRTVFRPAARRGATTRQPAAGAQSRRSQLLVFGAWTTLMAGVNLATPLYVVYAARYGFSNLVLTAVFAAYAVVLIPALVLFGRLSDRFGRRPVIVAGLLVACAGLGMFAAARSTAWLFGARILQGLAVGMISGAATAALVELDPRRDARRAALLAGLAQAGGSTAGPIVAGALAQWAPAPRQLCYLLALGVTLAAGAVTLTLPEPTGGEREPWRIQRPRVPPEIRREFARVSVTAATVWATVALYLSIVPPYASKLLHTRDLALLAAISTVALAFSCGAQVVARRHGGSPRSDQAVGLVLLAAGLLGLVMAAPLQSLTVLLVGAAAAGAGHGIGFVNAQDELNAIAPDEHRAEVTAAFISCIYLLVAGAVVATGFLDLRLSLSLAVAAVAVVLAATAFAAAAWQVAEAHRPR